MVGQRAGTDKAGMVYPLINTFQSLSYYHINYNPGTKNSREMASRQFLCMNNICRHMDLVSSIYGVKLRIHKRSMRLKRYVSKECLNLSRMGFLLVM